MNTPLALLGLPSVQDVVEKVAKFFFGGFADALTPDWLKNASGKFFAWMVAIPNPAAGKAQNVIALEQYTMSLAIGLFGLVAFATAARYFFAGAAGDVNPLEGVVRIFAAAGALLSYNWIFQNATALINQITHMILTAPVVARGLNSLAKTLFVTSGFGADPLSAIFKLIALALVIMLCAVKVALLLVVVMLFVAGPLAIALWPLPELSGITAGWKQTLGSLLMVPIVWTLLFATAAVFVKDIPALIGLGQSGFAKAAAAAIFTPLFSIMVLFVGFKAATGAFASIKMTGHNLVASASPMGGRGRAGSFAAGLATSEARSAARKQLPSGQGSGTSKLREMATTAASAATGGAAGAAAASTGSQAATAAASGASQAPATSVARQIGTQAAVNGAAPSGRNANENHGATVPPPAVNRTNGATPDKSADPANRKPPTPAPTPTTRPSTPAPGASNGKASTPGASKILVTPGAASPQTPRPGAPNNSAPKSPAAPSPSAPRIQRVERTAAKAPIQKPSAPPPAAPAQPGLVPAQPQRKAGTPHPSRRPLRRKD